MPKVAFNLNWQFYQPAVWQQVISRSGHIGYVGGLITNGYLHSILLNEKSKKIFVVRF
jgi:hypothetical protein